MNYNDLNEAPFLNAFQAHLQSYNFLKKSIFNVTFSNKEIEEKYLHFNNSMIKPVRICFNLYSLLVIIIRIFMSTIFNSYFCYFIFDLVMAFLATLIFFLNNFILKKHNKITLLSYIFSLIIFIVNLYNVIISHFFLPNANEKTQLWDLYIFVIVCLPEMIFSCPYNIIFLGFFFVFTNAISLVSFFIRKEDLLSKSKDVIIIFFLMIAFFYFKYIFSIQIRMLFIKNLNINKLNFYFLEFFNFINEPFIIVRNKSIILHNNLLINLIKNSTVFKTHLQRRLDTHFLEKSPKMKACLEGSLNDKNCNNSIKDNDFNFNFYYKKKKNVKLSLNNLNATDDSIRRLNKKYLKNLSLVRIKKEDVIQFDRQVSKSFCVSSLNKDDDYFIRFKKPNCNKESITLKNLCKTEKDSLLVKEYNENGIYTQNTNNDKRINNNETSNSSQIFEKEENSIENISIEEINNLIKNDLGREYLKLMKLQKISEQFSYLKADNLLSLYERLKDLDSAFSITEKPYYLGEFSIEADKKIFQIYFRKNALFKDLVDFVISDITKIKEAEEKEYNIKSKLFAKIAHEFKTPMSSIICLINKIKNDYKSHNSNFKSLNFKFTQIENLSSYVISLTNDIIEYSNLYNCENCKCKYKFQNANIFNDSNSKIAEIIRHETGHKCCAKNQAFHCNLENVDLKKIAKFCKSILETLLISKEKEKYIKINYEFEERIEEYKLMSDEFRLKQIILNLISNAVKFTKSGSITIKASLVESNMNIGLENQSTLVKISIIDTGIGIKQNKIKKLLKYKENTKLVSSVDYNMQAGSGWGLCIIKYLADSLNHKLEIDSVYGQGSSFSLLLVAKKDKNAHFFHRRNLGNLKFQSTDLRDLKYVKYNASLKNCIYKFSKFYSLVTNKNSTIIHDVPRFISKSIKHSQLLDKSKIKEEEHLSLNENFYNQMQLISNNSFIGDSKKCNSDNIINEPLIIKHYKNNIENNDCLNDEIYFQDEIFDSQTVKCNQHLTNPYKVLSYENLQRIIRYNDNNFDSFLNSPRSQTSRFSDELSNFDNKFYSPRENVLESQNNKRVILIVDDHLYIRESVKMLLNKILKDKNLLETFTIKEGNDGCNIITNIIYDQFDNNKIKCVITDENMEFINGSEAIKIVRNLQSQNKIKPVIIASLSAFEDDLMKKVIQETGVDYILSKPCNESNLLKFFEKFNILK